MILIALYYALPGLVANMAPVLVKDKYKWLARPIDMGRRFRGKPIFGAHKTFRGIFVGLGAAILTALLQMLLYEAGILRSISYVDYTSVSFISVGLFLGSGALAGDLIKSFIKRRLGIAEGRLFIPWDQVDCTLGIVAFSTFIRPMTLVMVLVLLLLVPILTILINHIAFFLKFRESKW